MRKLAVHGTTGKEYRGWRGEVEIIHRVVIDITSPKQRDNIEYHPTLTNNTHCFYLKNSSIGNTISSTELNSKQVLTSGISKYRFTLEGLNTFQTARECTFMIYQIFLTKARKK